MSAARQRACHTPMPGPMVMITALINPSWV
jgi:hypothetical protein